MSTLPGTESLPSVDGPWTGEDWEDSTVGFKIDNGRVMGTKPNLERLLRATARCGIPKVDLNNPENNGDNV